MQWPSFDTVVDHFRSRKLAFHYEAIPLVNEETGEQLGPGTGASTKPLLHAHASTAYKTWMTVSSVLALTWTAVRPTFLRGFDTSKKPIPPTAWLNGVRGCASFNVVLFHLHGYFYPGHGEGWSSQHPHFLELPIIRVFYHGSAMVTIFFIVSGYSLSYKPITLIAKREPGKVFDAMASSLFRRGFRLFVPTATIALAMLWVDYFSLNYPPRKPNPKLSSVSALFSYWFDVVITSVNPCHRDIPYKLKILDIDYVFWTIPTEYRGSLFIFGLLIIMAKARPSMCFATLIAVLLWLTYCGQSDIWLFVAGTLCCAIKHLNGNDTPRPSRRDLSSILETPRFSLRRVLLEIVAPSLAMIPVLYILTQPGGYLRSLDWEGWGDAPFYPTLNAWAPKSFAWHDEYGRFWRIVSGACFILLVDHTAIFRRFFEFSFPQYLGKISFSLYLCHCLVIRTVMTRFKPRIYAWTEPIGIWWIREVFRLGLCGILLFPMFFWISELATKYVDDLSVSCIKRMENLYYAEQKSKAKTESMRMMTAEPVVQRLDA